MTSSASRFKRLPPPRTPARAKVEAKAAAEQPAAEQPGLFAHYGVELEPRGADVELAAVVDACACPSCGWRLRADSREPCPICASAPPS